MACGVTRSTALLDQAGFCRNGANVAVMCGQTLGAWLSETPLCPGHDRFPSENRGIGHEGKWGHGSKVPLNT